MSTTILPRNGQPAQGGNGHGGNGRGGATPTGRNEDTPRRPAPARQEGGAHQRISTHGSAPKKVSDSTPAGDRHYRHFRHFTSNRPGLMTQLYTYFARHIILDQAELVVICAWVMATWLLDVWDDFGILGITSPVKRCGKSLLLDLLDQVCPDAHKLLSPNPAPIYRRLPGSADEMYPRPTFLLDEAQCLGRGSDEHAELLLQIFCGGISKTAFVSRCVGQGHIPVYFSTYCPKVIALIGTIIEVLADRCFPIRMRRKGPGEEVVRKLDRQLRKYGAAFREKLAEWSGDEEVRAEAERVYARLKPLDISNDRLAGLLLPLQTVLIVVGQTEALAVLEKYARDLDRKTGAEDDSAGIQLLAALRDILQGRKGEFFSTTDTIIPALVQREEEPWAEWSHGDPITPHALRGLLREFGIRPTRNVKQTCRGYLRRHFEEVWELYLPPLDPPTQGEVSEVSIASTRSGAAGRKGGAR
jgi:Protein of unknown function (DUF3631)